MQGFNLRQRRLKREVKRAEMAAVFAKSAVAMALSKVWQSRLRHRYCTWKKNSISTWMQFQSTFYQHCFKFSDTNSFSHTLIVCHGSSVRPQCVVCWRLSICQAYSTFRLSKKRKLTPSSLKQIYPEIFFALPLTRAGAVTGHFLFLSDFLTHNDRPHSRNTNQFCKKKV